MPSSETVNEFLNDMAKLGNLFQENAKKILKQDKMEIYDTE